MNNKYAFWLSLSALSVVFIDNVAAENILPPGTNNPNTCLFQNINTYGETTVHMIPVYQDTIFNCPRGHYLPQLSEACDKCPENFYCPGGEYLYSENDVGIFACPNGTFTRTGMWELTQCGRILHVGNDVLYLRSSQKTSPSLNFDMNSDGIAEFFGNMTLANIPMNSQTDKKLKINKNNQIYYVYDDSIDPSTESQEQTQQENE